MGTPYGLMEIGRGGACVPARVALQGRIYPNHNDTHTFLFQRMGAGVRDAFPPPMCVYGLFTRFIWVDCAWVIGVVEGGLRVNV